MKLLLFVLTLSSYSYAFTLNNNFGGSFKSNKVKVQVAGNSSCSAQTGVTIYELQSLVEHAIADYWENIPTTNLRLKNDGFTDTITNMYSGRLCAPTDSTCISTAPSGTLIPPVNNIVISCNNDPVNFNGANVFAVSIPNNFSGKKITGSVILINDSSTVFSTLNREDKIAVLAHEIGHAIGLGHSKDDAALMYYKQVDMRRNLGQDDIDGVSYLYPKLADACGLFGATINDVTKIPPTLAQMGISFFMMLILAKLFKQIRRNLRKTSLS